MSACKQRNKYMLINLDLALCNHYRLYSGNAAEYLNPTLILSIFSTLSEVCFFASLREQI